MIQGDVCLYSFKAPDKRRPVLVLTQNNLISVLNAITIAPITTTILDRQTYVFLDETDGMREECAINLASIQTVPKNKIGSMITHLSPARMWEVREAIKFTFGFDE